VPWRKLARPEAPLQPHRSQRASEAWKEEVDRVPSASCYTRCLDPLPRNNRIMRIALLGTRGIPASYGGFETFAEELATRLVERGHSVTVYCRTPHPEPYRGVECRYLPTIRHKYFDTLAHTALSSLDLLRRRYDAVLYCNAANAVFTLLPRLLGMPSALNVDGLERNRKKWNALAKSWYRMSEWLATWCPTAVVTDAKQIESYYRERYGKLSTFIPYGAETEPVLATDVVRSLGLTPGRYVLYVSRLEPENNALLVREAFERVSTDMRLALVGDAPYAAEYIRKVKDTTDSRIIVPGAIYGEGYRQLQSHCFVYVQATEVGGTHPALIEAMGRGALVLYLNTPENAEVAGDAAVAFEPETLAAKLQWAVNLSGEERDAWGTKAQSRIREHYSWQAVTSAYESLLRRISGNAA
jgi:glycosyltransferase involved in cell wall biosynthesis